MSTSRHGTKKATTGWEIGQFSSRCGKRGNAGEEDGRGAGRVVHQHHPLPGHRRSGEGELRPSRSPHGLRANGSHPVRRGHALQSQEPLLVQPRQVCPVCWPWLHAPIRLPAPRRLWQRPGTKDQLSLHTHCSSSSSKLQTTHCSIVVVFCYSSNSNNLSPSLKFHWRLVINVSSKSVMKSKNTHVSEWIHGRSFSWAPPNWWWDHQHLFVCLFFASLFCVCCADGRLEAIQAVEESYTWSPREFWNPWCWGHHR